jgi:hypothetical protein
MAGPPNIRRQFLRSEPNSQTAAGKIQMVSDALIKVCKLNKINVATARIRQIGFVRQICNKRVGQASWPVHPYILGPNRTRPCPQRRMYFTFAANEFSMVTIPRAKRGERFC